MRRLGLLALLALGTIGCKAVDGTSGGQFLPPANGTTTGEAEPVTAVDPRAWPAPRAAVDLRAWPEPGTVVEPRAWPGPPPRLPWALSVSARLAVRAVDMDGLWRDGPGPFDIARTAKVTFVVEYSGMIPDGTTHVQQINVVTANGGLYQSLRAAVPAAADRVQSQADLPIAGTTIAEYLLAGTWTVDAHLDDDPIPLANGSFVLE